MGCEKTGTTGKREMLWKDDYFEWVKDNWTSRGDKLDFINRPYLVQVYRDQSQEIVYKKSAQAGLTERMISEAIWLADQKPKNSLYLFPTSSTMSDLVQERVDVPLNNSDLLRDISERSKQMLGKRADNLGLKRMSRGYVYFRGSNSVNMITSIAADAFFADEVDRMTVENIPFFDKRLLNSNLKWKRWASTPTVTDFGIDKKWKESDQHIYHVKCNHCNEWQELTFWENIDQVNETVICKKCHKVIIPWKIQGEWVKSCESEIRGYFINQLFSPVLDIHDLIKSSKKSSEADIQQFYNQNLGLTYEPKGARLNESDISACVRGYLMPDKEEDEFIGIDVGKVFHVVVIGRKKLLDLQTFSNKDELINYIEGRSFKGMVIDALPETRVSQEIVGLYTGRAHYNFYAGIKPSADEWWKTDEDKVNSDRTLSLDVLFKRIKKQEIEFPKNISDYKEFISHLKSTVRIVSQEVGSKVKVEYKEISADHYLHALNYANIALDVFLKEDDEPSIFII